MSSASHLAKRFVLSLSRTEPAPADVDWVLSQLLPAEAELWQRMMLQDRRHALLVARRFVERRPTASRDEVAGALLHDIGKVDCTLGSVARVVATIIGPRGERFRRYHDHERIGAELLRAAGSSAVTIDLVEGRGPAASALADADDV
ncbi:MAG TPA: HD domain-containing protein [Ilumatobacteraceae bacterium]|nr:HD domain-containing protein [Ilumatobacteraceae bacterium]